MAGRAADLVEIPATLWQRAAMTEALSNRDMGRVFQLVRKYAGASQTQLAIACGMTQGKISDIMRDRQRVTALEVFERIADGLNMPDPARTTLGLAPAIQPPGADTAASQHAQRSAILIPPRDAPPAMGRLPVRGPSTVDLPGGEEDPVRRRTFVSLTGASLFGAVLASTGPGGPGDAVEAFAAVLAGYSPDARRSTGRPARPRGFERSRRQRQTRLSGMQVLACDQRPARSARPCADRMRCPDRGEAVAGVHAVS